VSVCSRPAGELIECGSCCLSGCCVLSPYATVYRHASRWTLPLGWTGLRCPLTGPVVLSDSPVQTAAERVYEQVRHEIIDGTLEPGTRVVEETVAKAAGVSRTPVREALMRLERENLIARSDRRMVVRSFSAGEVYDIYDLRAQVESYAARLATERIRGHEIQELTSIQERMVEVLATGSSADLGWHKRLAQINQSFHMVIVQAARSAPLERIMTHVVQTPVIYKAYLWYDEASKLRSVKDHEEMIEHLESRDAQAAERCWRGHIEFGRDVLVEQLKHKRIVS
jgi:DNA-binding GntR family transcriptional regulator